MNSSETEYRLVWLVENYTYLESCCLWLNSPQFTTEGLERTSWNFGLDAEFLADPNLVEHSVWVQRSSKDEGPEEIGIKFEITVTAVDGSTIFSSERNFRKGGSCSLVDMDKLCVPKNTDLFPRDAVVVRGRIWRGEGSAQKVTQCTARTRIVFEKSSFLLKVENFSTLEINKENTLKKIPSLSEGGCNVSAFLRISERDDDSIIVKVDSSDDIFYLDRKTLFLIDASGDTVQVDDDSDLEDDDGHEENLPKLTRQFIVSNKENYLPNDELTLMCELSIRREDSMLEETLHDIPMATYLAKYSNSDNNVTEQSAPPIEPENGKVMESDHLQSNEVSAEKKDSTDNIAMPPEESNQIEVMQNETNNDVVALPYPSATDDLKALYTHQLLTDVELKTATKSFSAHKLVLCVRSPVFKSLLIGNTQCIEVEDMEDETVHRLLLFLYADSLEDLQWASAIQLFRAGAKYDIESLKEFCSVFLVNNLNTSNASELLLLAETHGDANLKQSVNHFILEHDEEVFSSDDWRILSKTNPRLIVETMLLKYEREK